MHSTRLIPVEGHSNLARDPKTGAIINTNKNEYEKYVATRNKLRSDEEKLDRTVEQVEEFKKELKEIKDMLLKLTSGINTT